MVGFPNNPWTKFWFQNATTLPLDIVRVGIGALMLISYGTLSFEDILILYGEDGYLSGAAARKLSEGRWYFSPLYFVRSPWQLLAYYTVFLMACVGVAAGWRTSWLKWIAMIGHLSLMNRNPVITYGVDYLIASVLFLLCIAPTGRALSLDRVREVRRAKQLNLESNPDAFRSEWGFACIRLVQIQMCVFVLFSGLSKLLGESWLVGEALWFAVANNEFAFFPLSILAKNIWLVPFLTYYTIIVELHYPILIWGSLRAWALSAAITLHIGIAVFLGLWFFSLTAISAHLIFLRPAWLKKLGAHWKSRAGGMEMIYDGDCGFCKRSMAWFLAFDGLRQISIRNYRTNPSPIVPSEKVDEALYVVTADGKALPGFDAYRYVVLRVPGHWWMAPLFYVPVFSRMLGRPIYRWVASNRHTIPF